MANFCVVMEWNEHEAAVPVLLFFAPFGKELFAICNKTTTSIFITFILNLLVIMFVYIPSQFLRIFNFFHILHRHCLLCCNILALCWLGLRLQMIAGISLSFVAQWNTFWHNKSKRTATIVFWFFIIICISYMDY